MKIYSVNELIDMWNAEKHIHKDQLSSEASRTPDLHSKYIKIRFLEKSLLDKMSAEHTRLRLRKKEYYSGKFSKEDYEETGWDFVDMKILKNDVGEYVDADVHIQDSLLQLKAQENKVEIVNEILKEINTRSFRIRNIIEFERLMNGLS